MSQKTSSVVVTKRVMESRTSMTSLRTVTHKRSSSGKMIESWSSPSLELTSPQTWVSGPQAKFLSPSKSPSPKRRITLRSSVYIKPAWTEMSEKFLKSSPKGLEFKIPSGSATSISSARTSRSSVYQKSSGVSAISRRSSVHSKDGKGMSGSAVLVKQEAHKTVVLRGKKPGKILSPKGKISKSPSLKKTKISESPSPKKKTKSPARVTRARKRNVSELEKEESSEKPAAKRRKQAIGESIRESPKVRVKSSQKIVIKQLETSGSESSPSPSKANRKGPKKAALLATKTARSPSPQRRHTVKSLSPSRLAKKRTTKSSSPQRNRTAKSKSPSHLATKKTTKMPSPRRSRTVKSKSPHRKKSLRSKQKTKVHEIEDSNSEDTVLQGSVVSKSQKRKRKAVHDTLVQSPERKSARSIDTPEKNVKQKAEKLSPQTKSGALLSSSKKAKWKKKLTEKSSANEDRFSTPTSTSKIHLFEAEHSGKKTSAKKLKSGTPKSVSIKSNSKKRSHKTSVSRTKKILRNRGNKAEESSVNISDLMISSSQDMSSPSKKKSKLTKQKFADTPKTSKQKMSDTPRSEKKRSASTTKTRKKSTSAKSLKRKSYTPASEKKGSASTTLKRKSYTPASEKKGSASTTKTRKEKSASATSPKRKSYTPASEKKGSSSTTKTRKEKSASAKSPKRKSYTGTDAKGHLSTPKSDWKSKRKARKSDTEKLALAGGTRSSGRKASSEKLDASDSLDGSYLQLSGQQSKKKKSQSFLIAKKETKSKVESVVRSAEDEKILEILKKAVGSTPKSKIISTPKSKMISTPKSAGSFRTSKIISSTLKLENISTPVSARRSIKSKTVSVSSTPKPRKILTKSVESAKKFATPQRERNDEKFSTAKSQKSTKSAAVSREARVSQKSSVSLMSPRTSLEFSVTKTPLSSTERTTSSRQGLMTSLNQSEKAEGLRLRNDDRSGNFKGLSVGGDYRLARSSRSAYALDRRSGMLRPEPQASAHGQSYQEEKQFSQFVEYRGGSGLEKYGARAIERTVDDHTYRAGCYRTERTKGSQMEIEHEEGQWEEEDANNSAVSVSDDPNVSVSTSVHSNRCTIL